MENNIYETYMCGDKTQEKNNKLRDMYKTWFKAETVKNVKYKKYYGKNYADLTAPYLVTCTDAYLEYQKTGRSVMLFGQEANSSEGCFWDGIPSGYSNENGYSFENDILRGKCNKYYTKARKAVCGINPYNPENKIDNPERFFSVLANNLNKTSFGGKHLGCNKAVNGLYEKFYINDFYANVFIHELNILRPNIIIILGAKSYCEHIKRDFCLEGNALESVEKELVSLNTENKTVSDGIQINNCGNIEGYCPTFYFAVHPQALFYKTSDVQNEYNEYYNRLKEISAISK